MDKTARRPSLIAADLSKSIKGDSQTTRRLKDAIHRFALVVDTDNRLFVHVGDREEPLWEQVRTSLWHQMSVYDRDSRDVLGVVDSNHRSYRIEKVMNRWMGALAEDLFPGDLVAHLI